MTKEIILIDMDEVIVDLVDSWLDTYHQMGGELLTRDQITEYGALSDSKLIQNQPLFWKALDRAPAMRIAKPLSGATAALKRLYDDPRFDVHIVTYARTESWGRAHEAKLAWLWQHCPWFDRNRVAFVKHKELVRGDILIEDNPHTIDKWLLKNWGSQAYLIDQPWNKNSDSGVRVSSLEEAVNRIMEDRDE